MGGSRKIYLTISAKVIVRADEGLPMDDLLAGLQCVSENGHCDVEDFEITDHEVTDSK
jgi:hypothetical protein